MSLIKKLRSPACLALLLASNIATAQIFTKVTTGPLVNEANNSYYGAWGDYDKDGDLDIFHSLFSTAANNPLGNNLLFQNNCNGNFTRVNQIPGGLVSDGLTGAYCYWVDYDNDGDLDMYVGPKYLYENLGNGAFQKVNKSITTSIPPYPQYAEIGGAGWADYNNDGYLDLYFGKQEIHRNNQAGDWTQLNIAPFTNMNPNAAASSISWADYNNDGYMDVFVAVIGDNQGQPSPNYLYRNLGNGNFVSETSNFSMLNTRSYGASWADYDNDLDMDLFINGVFGDNDKLFTNNGNGTFTEVLSGPVVSDYQWDQAGGAWADYDNDGDLDLYVTNFNQNLLYDNNGNGTFTQNLSEIAATDTQVESYGACWADYDNDGDMDLFVITAFGDPNDRLYKNNVYQNNINNRNWFKLHLTGTSSNRDAVGARVYVKATINGVSKWQMREVNANSIRGGEAGGASGHVIHFGLGDALVIDTLKIVWPKSGITQIHTNVNPNRFVEIIENNNSLNDAVACSADMPVANPGYITGKVFNDVNNNCVFDAGTDFPIANKEVKAEPGAYFAFTDNNGDYKFTLAAGTYDVSLNPQNDGVSVQPCQAAVQNVNVTVGNTQGNKNFPASVQKACNGTYNVGITQTGIVQGPCPSGLLLTNPCPGFCHQFNFNIVNNTASASPPFSILAINFPPGFMISGVSSPCGANPLSPYNVNAMVISVPTPIPPGGNCVVQVVVCLNFSTANPPWTISASFGPPGPAPNLIVNGQFNIPFGSYFWDPGYAPQCSPTSQGKFWDSGNPAACLPGWNGPPLSLPNFHFANGTSAPNAVWRQTVTVLPNTWYQFTGNFANIISDGIPRALPQISVNINGLQTLLTPPLNPTTPFINNAQPITWNPFAFQWCSKNNTSAVIEIFSANFAAAGNDFGMDDLTFSVAPPVISYLTITNKCSCDPNDKSVTPTGCGQNGNIGKKEKLTYTIRFQNKGTGPATDVLISDKIDQNLDLGTLQIVGSSHNITNVSIIPNNNLQIMFGNINLPAEVTDGNASKGYVVFSIDPKPGVLDGTVINNQAGIYFDDNEVVLTEVPKNTLYTYPAPDPNFSYKHNCSQTGFVYDFAYTGNTPDNATYSWFFNGGTPATSNLQNPTGITFANGNGYKHVKLIVTRNGCTAEINDTIPVTSGLTDNGNKVIVCHNGNLIQVSTNALAAHLAHGDCIGECRNNNNPGGRMINGNLNQTDPQSLAAFFETSIVPNPSNTECVITVDGLFGFKGPLKIEVQNSLGQLVSEVHNATPTESQMNFTYDTRSLSTGVYFIRVSYGGQSSFRKLIIQH